MEKVLEIWAIEQDHDKKLPYRFQRTMGPRGLLQSWDSLPRKGLGGTVCHDGNALGLISPE